MPPELGYLLEDRCTRLDVRVAGGEERRHPGGVQGVQENPGPPSLHDVESQFLPLFVFFVPEPQDTRRHTIVGVDVTAEDASPDFPVLLQVPHPVDRLQSLPHRGLEGIVLSGVSQDVGAGRRGVDPGTEMIEDTLAGPSGGFYGPMAPLRNRVLYSANGGSGGALWRSDGTAAGTVFLHEVEVSVMGVEYGGYLYFSGNDTSTGHGSELWRSDGTTAGTEMVKDISPSGSSPGEFEVGGGILYFKADDGDHGQELWRTDGSSGNTSMVADLRAGAGSTSPTLLTWSGGTLYFGCDTDGSFRELCASDGTEANTRLVKEICPGTCATNMFEMVPYAGGVLFDAEDGATGKELWKSNGTGAGTVLYDEVISGPRNGPADTSWDWMSLIWTASRIFFVADDESTGDELWAMPLTGPGAVPDGDWVPGAGMGVERSGASRAADRITLTWGAGSCGGPSLDYAIYEGAIGDFDGYAPVTCSTGGATSWTFTSTHDQAYFLVVPHDGVQEGGYGYDSLGFPRPGASSACLPKANGEVCE